MKEKLKDVDDEAAREVLEQLLQPDVEDRPKDMKEVMNYEFFKARLDQDGSLKDMLKSVSSNINERFDHIDDDLKHITVVTEDTLRNTHKIIHLNNVMIQKIAQSTSTILQGVFEANEVTTPTCFIILPYKLEKKKDFETGKSKLQVAEESMGKAALEELVSSAHEVKHGTKGPHVVLRAAPNQLVREELRLPRHRNTARR